MSCLRRRRRFITTRSIVVVVVVVVVRRHERAHRAFSRPARLVFVQGKTRF